MPVSSDTPFSEEEIARQVTAFLTKPGRYNEDEPIKRYVLDVIREMAKEIAIFTVRNTPGIRQRIEELTRNVVFEIVSGDPEGIVSKSVAKAVGEVLADQRDKLRNTEDDG